MIIKKIQQLVYFGIILIAIPVDLIGQARKPTAIKKASAKEQTKSVPTKNVPAKSQIKELVSVKDVPAKGPYVVKFHSPSCGHCKAMEKPYAIVASENTTIPFYAVNISNLANAQAIAKHIGAKLTAGVPYFVFVKADGKVIEMKGQKPIEELRSNVKKIQ